MRTADLFGAALREAVALAGTIASSAADCQLAARYQEAVSHTDRISGDEPLEQARALHAFYQVIEDVIGRTAQKAGRVPRHDLSALASSLLMDLQDLDHDEYWKAKRIRTAAFQIATLERRPFRQEAEDAVRRLELDVDTLEAVLELQQRRNTQTGHPDTWPTADLATLVPLAEKCARQLMGAHFRLKLRQ